LLRFAFFAFCIFVFYILWFYFLSFVLYILYLKIAEKAKYGSFILSFSLSLSFWVKIIKYLGIVIDDRLRFKDHYDYMLKKIR